MQTFTGLQYLKLDIANNYGLDKKTWDERLAWFDEHEPKLEGMIGDDALRDKGEPALFFAGVQAYRQAAEGKATGYPISLDATASGLQILSVLTGDRFAAEICNVVDAGRRMDAYTVIYDEMLQRRGITDESLSRINRAKVKDAIMTSLFGSKKVPRETFGPLLDCFEQTMEYRCPAVWALNEWILGKWDPTAVAHDWILPDNFHVHIKVMDLISENVRFINEFYTVTRRVNQPILEGRSLGANLTHSVDGMLVRELVRRCNHDPIQLAKLRRLLNEPATRWESKVDSEDDKLVVLLWQHFQASGYLSARILDHLALSNLGHVEPLEIRRLLDSLPAKPFAVLANHDCFRCLPNYGNDLRKQYNLQLHLLAKSDLISYLINQIFQLQGRITKLDEGLAEDILVTNYALS